LSASLLPTARRRLSSGCRRLLPANGGAIAFLLLAVAAGHAWAGPLTCRRLETELATAGRSGSTAELRKYGRAVDAQRDQLAIARSRARRAGCGLGFLSPSLCGPLNDQIDRMETNLAALERKRDQLAGEARPRRSRAAILAALDASGCRDKPAAADRGSAEARNRPGTGDPGADDDGESAEDLFARLFGHGATETLAPESQAGASGVTRILNPNGEVSMLGGQEGQFATMCVRTCDGYFFPVSPNSSSADFERDQRNCEATCPGTEVRLYYRPVGSEDSDSMASVATGEPYASLPAAYAYKDMSRPRPLACGCAGAAANPNFSIVGDDEEEDKDVPAEPVIPAPAARPDPAADPETLANRDGRLDVATIRRLLASRATAAPLPPPGERRIRVVGPVFLPDPEGAIDLRDPGRQKVR
jgi:hypothetical protein